MPVILPDRSPAPHRGRPPSRGAGAVRHYESMSHAPSGTGGPVTSPYGAWPSPIGAREVAAGGVRLSGPVPVGDAGEVWWAEARPAEGGRIVVVRRDAAGTVTDVLPPGWSARSRVHEYGGTAWTPLPG